MPYLYTGLLPLAFSLYAAFHCRRQKEFLAFGCLTLLVLALVPFKVLALPLRLLVMVLSGFGLKQYCEDAPVHDGARKSLALSGTAVALAAFFLRRLPLAQHFSLFWFADFFNYVLAVFVLGLLFLTSRGRSGGVLAAAACLLLALDLFSYQNLYYFYFFGE